MDGIEWNPVNEDRPATYNGGISEIGWTFDLEGNLWGVGRNEDGDDSLWGSRIFRADSSDIRYISFFLANFDNSFVNFLTNF